MRFSTYRFFHDSNPSGPLINRLKYFRIWFRFHWDIQSQKCLRSVPHTMEINCILRNQNQNLYLSMVTFKETIRRNPCKSNTSTYSIMKKIFLSPHRLDFFVIEYFDEIETETEFENTLSCWSGPQMGLNHDKNWRSEISWHTPFKTS